MKNLIAELLIKLAEKEEESKELVAQVEALEIVVTAMLRKMNVEQQQDIAQGIQLAMNTAADGATNKQDAHLLHGYIEKLLKYPRS